MVTNFYILLLLLRWISIPFLVLPHLRLYTYSCIIIIIFIFELKERKYCPSFFSKLLYIFILKNKFQELLGWLYILASGFSHYSHYNPSPLFWQFLSPLHLLQQLAS